jgi:hypothetical protein
MTPVKPGAALPSLNSDQPIKPVSVVIFKNDNVRQPPSAWRSSIAVIFKLSPWPS